MTKRTAALALLATLVAGAALAATPGARYETRMVYDPTIQRIVMFGGLSALDSGTAKAYDLGDTWEWNGQKWVQRYTPTAPSARSSYSMVYDTNRQRTLLFGGKSGTATYYSDTWQYKGGVWSQIDTPNSPGARVLAGAAYDPLRDRFVVYGGTGLDSASKIFAYRDMWEFDGTTWTKVLDSGPDVAKPLLVYDRAHNKILMLAQDTSAVTHMYDYDPSTKTWTERKPTTLPPCVNEGMMDYDTKRDVVVYTGGTCATSLSSDETYEWNGTDNWTKITLNSDDGRAFGAGMAYDEAHGVMTVYGGFYSTAPRYQTYVYSNSGWLSTADLQPVPRSLAMFASDPVNNTVWLFGGTASGNTFADLWKYQNGHFDAVSADGNPSSCPSPNGAWDGDRKRIVLFCGSLGTTYEYDPDANKWTSFSPKHIPAARSFASLVYDPKLKKTVLFGGWDGSNFRDDTWTWEGTDWTQVKKDPPPSRELASMWYDPILQKTVIYGGLGRLTQEDRLTRYNDQWQFDGTAWSEIKPATLPGARYGARVATDPRNNHTYLFGGLQVTGDPANLVQSYAADTWEWDGTTWKQITTDGNPPARENQAIAFDPNRNELVMFGGYAGYYLGDIWSFTNFKTWRPWTDTTLRRRAAGR